jgi:hypothetical protein
MHHDDHQYGPEPEDRDQPKRQPRVYRLPVFGGELVATEILPPAHNGHRTEWASGSPPFRVSLRREHDSLFTIVGVGIVQYMTRQEHALTLHRLFSGTTQMDRLTTRFASSEESALVFEFLLPLINGGELG